MKSLLFASLALIAICGLSTVSAQATPTCDASTGISQEDCNSYIEMGAIYVTFDGRSEALTAEETEMFKVVIANISNDYVIPDVKPKHVVIVQRGRNTVSDDFALYFFILNPSGSTYMPVALRRQELYLMVKLNNDMINTYLDMDVTAQAPPSSYPLVIPAWAIAILGYVGLIILIYALMVLTSDWRRQKMANFEAELEKQYHETNGVTIAGDIPMKKIPNGNDYEVVAETKNTHKTIGVQTPRHVAVQVDPEDMIRSQAKADDTTEVVIENGYSTIDNSPPPPPPESGSAGDNPTYDMASPSAPPGDDQTDTADIVPLSSVADDNQAQKEADDAAAAIEGAINEGFEAEAEGGGRDSHLPSTQL